MLSDTQTGGETSMSGATSQEYSMETVRGPVYGPVYGPSIVQVYTHPSWAGTCELNHFCHDIRTFAN